MATATIHASCVLIGTTGVLIRGPSGAGKSTLAWTLIETERNAGRPASLVSDDRVLLRAAEGRIVASPPPNLAGLIELRGLGIARVGHAAQATIGLVVDLDEGPIERLPAAQSRRTILEGVEVSRLAAPHDRAALLVLAALNTSATILSLDTAE